jgi:hypothetical protein
MSTPDGLAAYRDAVRRLTALDDEAAELRAEAERWHADRLAAAARAERAADDEVAAAAREVDAARRAVDEVDARAAALWSEYVHRVGPAAERYGRTVPEPVVPKQRASAEEFLRDVASQLAYTPPARPVTNLVQVLFALIGAAGGAAGFALGQAVRWAGRSAGGDWAVGLPVPALLLTLLGPVLAAGAAKLVADRRGGGLDAATVALVVGAGLAVIAVCHAVFR